MRALDDSSPPLDWAIWQTALLLWEPGQLSEDAVHRAVLGGLVRRAGLRLFRAALCLELGLPHPIVDWAALREALPALRQPPEAISEQDLSELALASERALGPLSTLWQPTDLEDGWCVPATTALR